MTYCYQKKSKRVYCWALTIAEQLYMYSRLHNMISRYLVISDIWLWLVDSLKPKYERTISVYVTR